MSKYLVKLDQVTYPSAPKLLYEQELYESRVSRAVLSSICVRLTLFVTRYVCFRVNTSSLHLKLYAVCAPSCVACLQMSSLASAPATRDDVLELQRERFQCPSFAKESIEDSIKIFSMVSQSPVQFIYKILQNVDDTPHHALAPSLTFALCGYDPRDQKQLPHHERR